MGKVNDWHQYSGAIHIHTTESDGTKALEDVVALGQSAGLDFMMFSDHMNLNNRDKGKEGIYGKTLVVIGYEHNDLHDEHHYLLFDVPRVYKNMKTPNEYVPAGSADNAIGILAHPDEIRFKLKEFPPYPWKNWDIDGYNGLELWNQMSEWMERLTRFNKLIMAFSPRKSMVAPTDRILRKWDELNLKKKICGIASVDAHAFPIKVGPLKVEIFPYKVHFRCLRTHIILSEPLSGKFETARDQLYGAIRNCNLYFSNMRWGNADNFLFFAENDKAKVASGGDLNFRENTKLVGILPSKAKIKIIHNGRPVLESNSDEISMTVQYPGIYRLEAWKGRQGWIFSNHIRIGLD